MNPRLTFAALLLLGIGAAAPSIVFPGIIGALAASGRYTPVAAASIVSGELVGMMIAAALVAWAGARIAFRRVAIFCVLSFLCLDAASALSQIDGALLPLRVLAGMGEGGAIAAMAAMAASLASAERYFAVSVACNLAVSAVLLRVFPAVTQYGIAGVFALLAVVALPALVLARALPATQLAQGTAQKVALSRGVVLACLATFLFFAAMSSVWAFVTVAADVAGLTFAQSSSALSWATAAGIVTGLVTSWAAPRVSRSRALLIGTGALALVIALFAYGTTLFAPATIALMVTYVFALPFYFGTIAALDRSGRVMAFAIALQFAGLAAGPAIAAVLLESGLARIFWFACVLCAGAGILATLANRTRVRPATGDAA